jgi:hypothetical protein
VSSSKKKSKALPIAIATLALVVIAVVAFGIPRLFSSKALSNEATDLTASPIKDFGSAPPLIENVTENANDQTELSSNGNVGLTVPFAQSVGERVEFGTWRDKPITWKVLAIEDDRALVISEDILTVRQYDDLGASSSDDIDWDIASTTWAESDIRAWLNSEFLNTAFAREEQKVIVLTPITNSDNPKYGTEGGPDTEDKVFLLSIDEANRYFSNDSDRIANITMTDEDIQYSLRIRKDYWGYDQEELTTYESALRNDYLAQSKALWWWLRSPGRSGLYAADVYSHVYVDGFDVYGDGGVRPALWLNLKS